MPPAAIKDLLAKTITMTHETVFRLSQGRLLGKIMGMPVVILTTTGRRSGQRRSTMLTTPLSHGAGIVLVASYGGDDRHPAWFLNLQANPAVEVTAGGSTRKMWARIASADEKAELWPKVVAAYKGYGAYQERTDRDIPLVIVEPAGA